MALPDFISVTADVGKLARSVPTADFDTNAIIKEQKAAFGKIVSNTHKATWNTTDDGQLFYDIQKIEQQLAAAYILQYYGIGQAASDLAASLLQTAKDGLEEHEEESTDPAADIDDKIATSNYESYPASLQDDPNATPYRSTNNSVV